MSPAPPAGEPPAGATGAERGAGAAGAGAAGAAGTQRGAGAGGAEDAPGVAGAAGGAGPAAGEGQGAGAHGGDEARARLFVAAWPPPDVVERLAALERPDRPGLRWTRPEQWHVTLRFLGQALLGPAVEAVRAVRAPVAAVELGPATARLGRGVLCLPARGLDEVAAAVLAATAEVGEPPEDRPFRGHLTLARAGRGRGGGRRGRGRGAGQGAELADLVGVGFSAAFTVEEVTLVRSVGGRGGHRYEVVARTPLGDGTGHRAPPAGK